MCTCIIGLDPLDYGKYSCVFRYYHIGSVHWDVYLYGKPAIISNGGFSSKCILFSCTFFSCTYCEVGDHATATTLTFNRSK